VTVTVWDSASAPKPDVDITIDGWGIAPVVDRTDSLGEAHFSVTPPYGEDLTVVGRESGQGYDCFHDVLPVTGGVAFGSPDIHGDVPEIGLYGSLAPDWDGIVTGTAVESFFDIFVEGCGVSASGNSGGSTTVQVHVMPTSAGTVRAALAKAGFDVYLEDIVVAVVYGQISGEVYEASRAPIVGAKLKAYPAGADTTGATPVFEATTGTGGAYTVTGDVEVGYYDVYVSKFAYLPLIQKVLIEVGANDEDFYLDAAPSGVVSGTVTEVTTGRPLSATIKVYRVDTMELYAQTTSDSLLGGAYTVELPYFNYTVNVRAYHHIPVNQGISVNDPAETADFELERTLANILVISDGVTKGETVKVDKTGAVLDVYEERPSDAKSALQIATDLVALGYDVTQETAASSNPATWLNYDFIVTASGDNTSPVADASYRTGLESYVAAGGKLLVEGGEVGYDSISYPGYPTFAANVLHIASWQHDSSGSLRGYDMTHPVTTTPNTIGTIAFTYVGYGDQDSNTPLANAKMVCDWSTYPGLSGVIVYDDNPDPAGGQMVFFEFNYLAAGTGRMDLLENAVAYLMAPESTPTGRIGGMAFLEGQSDNSGIKVTAAPGGSFAYTDVSGQYEIEGLYAGTYTVQASKTGWSIGQVTGVQVSEGQLTGGVSFLLYAIEEYSQCVNPALAIPDNVPVGVYSTLTFVEDVTITDVEIYVNITHTFIGDLIVEVRSPQGTTVRLHNRAGGSADNLVGWYDSGLAVGGPGALTDFIGQHSNGDWRIWVSDNAGLDTGTLNTWCVKVVGGAPTGVPETGEGPSSYVLRGVSPNPFNPVTEVSYGVPEVAGSVTIAVYSVSGRLVRVLVDGEQEAGYHSVVWDGKDEGGAPAASGVYFCRMNAPGFQDAAKLVLLK
jgi:subtilisin-like proprotein convertase family protein